MTTKAQCSHVRVCLPVHPSRLQTVAFEALSICSPGSNHSEPKSFFLMLYLSLCTLFYVTRLLHTLFQRMLLYDIKAEGFKWTPWDCFLEDGSGILNFWFLRSFAILLTSYGDIWNLSWFWVIASLCKLSINGFIMATIKNSTPEPLGKYTILRNHGLE